MSNHFRIIQDRTLKHKYRSQLQLQLQITIWIIIIILISGWPLLRAGTQTSSSNTPGLSLARGLCCTSLSLVLLVILSLYICLHFFIYILFYLASLGGISNGDVCFLLDIVLKPLKPVQHLFIAIVTQKSTNLVVSNLMQRHFSFYCLHLQMKG